MMEAEIAKAFPTSSTLHLVQLVKVKCRVPRWIGGYLIPLEEFDIAFHLSRRVTRCFRRKRRKKLADWLSMV